MCTSSISKKKYIIEPYLFLDLGQHVVLEEQVLVEEALEVDQGEVGATNLQEVEDKFAPEPELCDRILL